MDYRLEARHEFADQQAHTLHLEHRRACRTEQDSKPRRTICGSCDNDLQHPLILHVRSPSRRAHRPALSLSAFLVPLPSHPSLRTPDSAEPVLPFFADQAPWPSHLLPIVTCPRGNFSVPPPMITICKLFYSSNQTVLFLSEESSNVAIEY